MSKKYNLQYLLFTIVVLIAVVLPLYLLLYHAHKNIILLNSIFFAIITYPIGLITQHFAVKSPGQTPTIIIGMTFLKMIVSVVFFLLIYKHFSEFLYFFTASFFVSYLIFTTFEVTFIVRFLNKKQ